MILAHLGHGLVQDFSAASKIIQLGFWIIALQFWKLIFGYSITLATTVMVISLLGIKLLRNSGYSI